MGQGLWEVCTELPSHRIARLLLGFDEGALVATARIHQEEPEDARRRTGIGAQARSGNEDMGKKQHGSSLDSLLKEASVFEEMQALAIKGVVVWQLTETMEKRSLSEARLAVL